MPNPPPPTSPHALTLQNPSKKSPCIASFLDLSSVSVHPPKRLPVSVSPRLTYPSARPLHSLLWLALLVWGVPGVRAGETWGMVSICPFHCVCRNLSESLSTLCVNKGLLFVPPDIDRRTVELRLADNFIVEVGGSDFANMTGLVDLTLSRNTLHALRPLAFSDLESLRSLHLDSNRLTAVGPQDLSGLVNLQHLILNNNQLTDVSDEAFQDFLLTLEDLDLSYNNLREAPWEAVQNMASLHTLNLDHNLIERIPEGAFGELYKLARLDMTSNRLQTLPPDPLFARSQPGVISPTPYNPVTSLNFGGNPLHCNCELLWLRRLIRPDDMETCATPAHLAGRYFWSVPEEEFTCEPPLIARHTHQLWVLEGQRATLRCRAVGDPEPLVHWVSPDDRIVANSSRIYSYRNGTLDVLVTRARDDGTYTCIAINAAGEATAPVDLRIIPLPHRGNRTAPLAQNRDTGPSDISAGKGGGREGAGNATGGGGDGGAGGERRVGIRGITATTADVHWHVGAASLDYLPWMYQIQYNSTADETLMYRILPSTSDSFRLRNLVSGADYTLCVLAVFDDGITSLSATKVLGCAQFSTKDDFPKCRSLQAHFLGGTLSVLVGGAVVVTLLVFTVAAMVRHHRACGHHDDGGSAGGDESGQAGSSLSAKATSVYSQTNGDGAMMMVVLPNVTQLPPKPKSKHKSKAPPKPKNLTEPYGGGAGGGDGGGTSLTMAVPEKRFPPFTPESERVTLYYTPAHTSATLPYRLSRAGKTKPRRPGVVSQGASKEDATDTGGACPEPRTLRAKRSCSFDMGEVATTTCYSYAKRLSVIWTRRSQSLHGMLVQCASAASTSSSGSDHHTHALTRGYLHAYGGSDSGSSAITNGEELEESVV